MCRRLTSSCVCFLHCSALQPTALAMGGSLWVNEPSRKKFMRTAHDRIAKPGSGLLLLYRYSQWAPWKTIQDGNCSVTVWVVDFIHLPEIKKKKKKDVWGQNQHNPWAVMN